MGDLGKEAGKKTRFKIYQRSWPSFAYDLRIRKRMEKLKLSAVIIAKNEEKKIEDCVKSLAWVDEIIFVDSGSTDKTIEIAKKYNARVFMCEGGSYDSWRNEGLKRARGKWILYVDADERVTEALRDEIIQLINNPINQEGAYAIPRRNIILGKEMKHGGWWPDYVKRLFNRDVLIKWSGALHEEPHFKGELGLLKNPLLHLKHDNLSEMIEKTNIWSEKEAELLYRARHPRMAVWRFFRIILTELWFRLVVKKGFLDGAEGMIYAIYQSWSKFITYAKLWEMQLRGQKL